MLFYFFRKRPGGMGDACGDDADCDSPLVCDTLLKVCKSGAQGPCTNNDDCTNGFTCTSGICKVVATPAFVSPWSSITTPAATINPPDAGRVCLEYTKDCLESSSSSECSLFDENNSYSSYDSSEDNNSEHTDMCIDATSIPQGILYILKNGKFLCISSDDGHKTMKTSNCITSIVRVEVIEQTIYGLGKDGNLYAFSLDDYHHHVWKWDRLSSTEDLVHICKIGDQSLWIQSQSEGHIINTSSLDVVDTIKMTTSYKRCYANNVETYVDCSMSNGEAILFNDEEETTYNDTIFAFFSDDGDLITIKAQCDKRYINVRCINGRIIYMS